MERKLAAILAADVVGYSALMETDEAGTHERLKAGRHELFEPEIARHHGRVLSRASILPERFAPRVRSISKQPVPQKALDILTKSRSASSMASATGNECGFSGACP